MTTNAIDRKKVIVASDSRWSCIQNDNVFFVDDTGFDKIVVRQEGAMICAGDGHLIDLWKHWFAAPIVDVINLPPTERQSGAGGQLSSIDVTLVATTGQVVFSRGWYIALDERALFAGSGAAAAYECFSVNMCAKTSVGSAMKVDHLSGGEVKYAELAVGRNNLSIPPRTLQDANAALTDRGYAMNMTTKKVITMKEYIANQGGAGGTVKAETGGFNLSAPTGQFSLPWTDAERDRLRSAVQTMTGQQPAEDLEAM